MRVDSRRLPVQISFVGRTKRKSENVYIDHDKYTLFVQFAKRARIPRAVLWREALDDILTKYGVITKPNSDK
jgi:hypothetical protein